MYIYIRLENFVARNAEDIRDKERKYCRTLHIRIFGHGRKKSMKMGGNEGSKGVAKQISRRPYFAVFKLWPGSVPGAHRTKNIEIYTVVQGL